MQLPILNQLHIFQELEYSPNRYLIWWSRHLTSWHMANKKVLAYTIKLKILLLLWMLLYALILLVLSNKLLLLLVGGSLFFLFPAPLLIIAMTLIQPMENLYRSRQLRRIKSVIGSMEQLQVIGVTGSFGKTTTKDFLFQILNNYKYSLKTPESFNTDLGIARVIDLELNRHHRFFVCELAAYGRGDIANLAQAVQPQYGLLTAIGPQHLERFGNLEAIINAKFELVEKVGAKQSLVNWDSPPIREHIEANPTVYTRIKRYSFQDKGADFFVPSYVMRKSGVGFDLVYRGRTKHFSAPIFGTSNVYNLVGAVAMAKILSVPDTHIEDALLRLRQSPHRMELKPLGKSTLIDNAYSSNLIGFEQTMQDLRSVPGSKVLITPGLIELGTASQAIHENLGRLAAEVFKEMVLVGESAGTRALARGWRSATQKPFRYITDSHVQIQQQLATASQQYDWILLENDLPDTVIT